MRGLATIPLRVPGAFRDPDELVGASTWNVMLFLFSAQTLLVE